MNPARIGIVLKGYPRLSETFVAQELLALERRGLDLVIWSLRTPTDTARHPLHAAIRAPVTYLPEYLHQAPLRVLRGLAWGLRQPGAGRLLTLFWRDLLRNPRPSRLRRLGQAMVLARETPASITHWHAHFLHAPSSVARYAAVLTGRSWSFSAHAKDIWTTPDWELREKIGAAAFGVTCTRDGLARLDAVATAGRVGLAYHGLDLSRFPEPPAARLPNDGSDSADPIKILCVGRLVAKKGHDDLIEALAALPPTLHWRLSLIGAGDLLGTLTARVAARGLSGRVNFLGARPQPDVIAAMRAADLFVLPTKPAPGGDRDGLPNVLMEAASQALPIVATDFAGTPEFLSHGVHAILVPPGDVAALSAAVAALAGDPARRGKLAQAARRRLVDEFSEAAGIDLIAARLSGCAGLAPVPPEDVSGEVCACGC